jgi:hypothetical protein
LKFAYPPVIMKKYAPPPERDPVPAMFVGDEEPPRAPVVSAKWKEAAATQPDDLSVMTKGEKMGSWVVMSPFLFVVGLSAVREWPRVSAAVMGGAVLYGLYGWALHWHAGKHLKLFRLTDEGITLTVRHRWGGKPRVTRIVWAEMRKYTEWQDADGAFLRVEDDFGGTILLKDHPARAAEFIRRFVEQAERHGVPSDALPPHPSMANEEKEDDPEVKKGLGCLFWFFGWGMINGLGDALGVQSDLTMVLAIGLPSLALYLWNLLDNSEVALRDRTSRKLMARLRRWLRIVLGIDVI